MNFSTGNQAISNTWKRNKLPYVTLAAGLALAVSAVAGLNGSFKSDSATTVSPRGATTISVQRGDQRPQVLFIVDNAEHANILRSAISTEAAALASVSSSQYEVWVVQNEHEQLSLNEAMSEPEFNAWRSGTYHAQFIDLREGAFKPQAVLSQASVSSSANGSAEEYAAREAAEMRLPVPAVGPAAAAFVESPEVTAAGEAWQHGVR